jgi:hypothetical protein
MTPLWRKPQLDVDSRCTRQRVACLVDQLTQAQRHAANAALTRPPVPTVSWSTRHASRAVKPL